MDIYRDFFDFSNVSSIYIPLLDNDLNNNLGPNIAPPLILILRRINPLPLLLLPPLYSKCFLRQA
jgi:hypothetical protein